MSFAVTAVLAAAAAFTPTVHVHTAGEPGFFANAYLVETEHGVVAVDSAFTVSEATRLKAELDALRKPLLAVLVTHAHPDHVNGVGILLAGTRDVPVLALAGVKANLEAIDGPKREYWGKLYKEDYPATTTFPDQLVKAGETVTFDGVGFQVLDAGRGESEDEAIWVLLGKEKAAFVGDLVLHQTHAWVAEGHTADWIASLARARKALRGVKTVYPGHGAPGTLAALDWQARYLETYREAVRALAAGGKLDDAGKKELAARMEAFLPGGKLAILVGLGADAVAAELAAR